MQDGLKRELEETEPSRTSSATSAMVGGVFAVKLMGDQTRHRGTAPLRPKDMNGAAMIIIWDLWAVLCKAVCRSPRLAVGEDEEGALESRES